MAGIGAITLDTAGAVTRPASMPLTLPSPNILTAYSRYSMLSHCPIPAQRGVMFGNGIDFVRHFIESTPYRTGLLAPSVAPGATPTGAKASTFLDTSQGGAYVIVDGDSLNLIRNTGAYLLGNRIVFVTSRSWSGLTNQVYFNGTTADAMTQLQKFVNQTGTEGVDYFTYYNFSAEIEVTATTTTSATIYAKSYGTAGNGYVCVWNGGAGPRFEVLSGAPAGAAQTVFSGGSAGSAGPSAGVYQYAYTYVREADGAESGLSPTVEVDNGGGGQVNLTMTLPDDSSVTYIRIYRTTNGGGLFYRVDEVTAATSSFSDTKLDSAITGFDATPFDPNLYRTYRAGYPPRVRYLAQYQGRWFGSGALLSADITRGTAAVTNGSASVNMSSGVSGSAALPRTNWIGRSFQASAVSETYTIIAVNESTKIVTIDRPYEGTTALTASYIVKDNRDPYELFFTEPGLPNNWTGSLKGPSSPDARGCTGLFAAFGSLLYFTRQSIWKISGTDGLYQVTLISDKCGCVGGQSIVMDGTNLYWLGQDGVYGWNGAGDPVNITTPPQQDVAVRGQDATLARLTLSHAHRSVAVHDQTRREIRWYLPMDGERYNRYALVFDTQSSVFSLDTCEDVTCAATVQGPDGEDHCLTGDITGAIYEQGLSTADGGYGIEPVNTVSSSTARTVTVSGTPFSTTDSGYWGTPVWHINATGEFARNCVASNTNNTLTYRRFMSAPAASTQFVLGGILLWIQTGRFDFGDRFRLKIVPAYIISHSPESDGQYFFFYGYDQSEMKIPTLGWVYGDLTVGSVQDDFGPRRRFRARKQAVLHGYGIACVEPGCAPRFSGVTIEVIGPSNLEV